MNKLATATDALWAIMQDLFADAATIVRNPAAPLKPKDKQADVAAYVALHDDRKPDVLRALMGGDGPTYDLEAKPRVIVAYLGKEADRRAAETDAIERLKARIKSDRTIGGTVEYAELEAPEDADAETLEWAAGGLIVPVRLLFNAPSKAG